MSESEEMSDAITEDDIAMCRGAAADAELKADESLEWGDRERQYEWERLAAKLKALLPPPS